MNYLDANFAAALHLRVQGQSEVAERFVRKNSERFVLSELAELECRRAFATRTGKADSDSWMRLQSFVSEGIWQREHFDWGPVSERAAELVDQFGTNLKAGTLDTLHIAHALHCGCTRFLSFDNDSNARVLAASCRLKVYPDLSAEEKGRVIRTR